MACHFSIVTCRVRTPGAWPRRRCPNVTSSMARHECRHGLRLNRRAFKGSPPIAARPRRKSGGGSIASSSLTRPLNQLAGLERRHSKRRLGRRNHQSCNHIGQMSGGSGAIGCPVPEHEPHEPPSEAPRSDRVVRIGGAIRRGREAQDQAGPSPRRCSRPRPLSMTSPRPRPPIPATCWGVHGLRTTVRPPMCVRNSAACTVV